MVKKASKTPNEDLTPVRGKRPRKVTLTVEMTTADRASAEKLAKMRTLQGLEAMLGDLVADIATAYERPGSWEAGRIWDWLDCRYDLPQFLRLERKEGKA